MAAERMMLKIMREKTRTEPWFILKRGIGVYVSVTPLSVPLP
jgi:hypothetical protein